MSFRACGNPVHYNADFINHNKILTKGTKIKNITLTPPSTPAEMILGISS